MAPLLLAPVEGWVALRALYGLTEKKEKKKKF